MILDAGGDWLLLGGIALGVGAVGVLGWAWVWAWRRRPGEAAARAVLDARGRCGGLLMIAGESAGGTDEEWGGRVGEPGRVRPRWSPRPRNRAAVLLLVAAVFLAGAVAAPKRFTQLDPRRPMDVTTQTDRIAEQVAALEQEKFLDAEDARQLRDELAAVAREAEGGDPVRTWEALDHLADKVEQAGREAAEEAVREAEELTPPQALAEGLSRDAAEMRPEERAGAMAELAQMAREAAQSSDAFREAIDPELDKALQDASLTPEQARELARQFAGRKEEIQQALERLSQAGLGGQQAKELARRMGAMNPEGLREFLQEMDGEMTPGEAARKWAERFNLDPGNPWEQNPGGGQGGGQPGGGEGGGSQGEGNGQHGAGGPGRGGGPSDLTWKDPSSTEGVEFNPEVLPPAGLEAARDAAKIGVSLGDPSTEGATAPDSTGALNDAQSGGGSARRDTVLPRHRGTVERYFERE